MFNIFKRKKKFNPNEVRKHNTLTIMAKYQLDYLISKYINNEGTINEAYEKDVSNFKNKMIETGMMDYYREQMKALDGKEVTEEQEHLIAGMELALNLIFYASDEEREYYLNRINNPEWRNITEMRIEMMENGN